MLPIHTNQHQSWLGVGVGDPVGVGVDVASAKNGSAVMPAVGVGSAAAGVRTEKVRMKTSASNPREAIPNITRIMTPLQHSHMCLNGKLYHENADLSREG